MDHTVYTVFLVWQNGLYVNYGKQVVSKRCKLFILNFFTQNLPPSFSITRLSHLTVLLYILRTNISNFDNTVANVDLVKLQHVDSM